jgi:2-alkenal reductase
LELPEKPKVTRTSTILILTTIIIALLAGGWLGYLIGYSTISEQIGTLQNQLSTLREQISNLQSTQNVTYIFGNTSLYKLYEEIKDGVVIIQGTVVQTVRTFFGSYTSYTQVQGSGFVYNFTGQIVIITNYHVVQSAVNVTVTFANGDEYAAKPLLGSDPYEDLAVLSTDAPQSEYKPLEIVSSSTLNVGDPVIAVGNPLGLGSMTSGIVSALGRSVTVDWSSYVIADCIQTSAPINPGNSGGPLINYQEEVVGITSYGVTDPSTGQLAQGIGLAIPSSTILREIESLVNKGSYNQHPWLGISLSPYFGLGTAATEGTVDLSYEIAKAMNTNITYGVLIDSVVAGGPADAAGLRGGTQQTVILGSQIRIGGDIIIAINGTRIAGMDDFSTYLEEHTLPNQTINITIVRNNQKMTLPVVLGTRS